LAKPIRLAFLSGFILLSQIIQASFRVSLGVIICNDFKRAFGFGGDASGLAQVFRLKISNLLCLPP
jgi:hypothetical protein